MTDNAYDLISHAHTCTELWVQCSEFSEPTSHPPLIAEARDSVGAIESFVAVNDGFGLIYQMAQSLLWTICRFQNTDLAAQNTKKSRPILDKHAAGKPAFWLKADMVLSDGSCCW